MAQAKGGRKLVRSGKDKHYYAAQFHRTAANKARRAAKRNRRKEYWQTHPKDEGFAARRLDALRRRNVRRTRSRPGERL